MRKIKNLFISIMAVVMLLTCTLGLAGCGEDIRKLEINFEIYNYEDATMEEHKLEIDLYRHLAPKTVDKIIEYVNDGYYDNNVVYVISTFYQQIMFGDLIFDGNFKQNAIKPQIEGEFKYGGTVGSNLKNKPGSVGLWRTWYAFEGIEGYKSSNATDTGRATCYIPTEAINGYNDYFCVFAQFDTAKSTNLDTMNALTSAFGSTENYDSYVVFYTGEYDETKENENFGLTFNIMPQQEYWDNEDSLDVFEVDEDSAQHVQYNPTTVRILSCPSGLGARIVNAKIV